MALEESAGIISGGIKNSPQVKVLSKEYWEEIRRMKTQERLSISEIGRRLQIDRKTVRKALAQEWKPYTRHGFPFPMPRHFLWQRE